MRAGTAVQGRVAAGTQEPVSDDRQLWVLAGKKRQELVAVDGDDPHGKIKEDGRWLEKCQLVLGFDRVASLLDEAALRQALQQGFDASVPEKYGIFDKEQPYILHVAPPLPDGGSAISGFIVAYHT